MKEDELPRRLYLEERAAYELPGFEIDFEESFQLSAVAAPDEVSAEALGAVVEELEASGIACQACDVVRRKTEREGRLAVRFKGWEEASPPSPTSPPRGTMC